MLATERPVSPSGARIRSSRFPERACRVEPTDPISRRDRRDSGRDEHHRDSAPWGSHARPGCADGRGARRAADESRFGLLPALRIIRARGTNLAQRTGNTAEVGRLRELLTIAQFAPAFVVLVAADLVFASSRALEATRVGYDPTRSLTLRVSLPRDTYAGAAQRAAFFNTLLDRLRPYRV
jgi:hypothetical protein